MASGNWRPFVPVYQYVNYTKSVSVGFVQAFRIEQMYFHSLYTTEWDVQIVL